MKNKTLVSLLLTATVAVSSLGGIGCGTKVKDDANTVQVSVFNGGWGLDWLYAAEREFERIYPDVDIVIDPQDLLGQISNQIKSGPSVNSVDLYFASEDVNSLLLMGPNTLAGYNMVFEPLDEVYDYVVNDNKTVREKCSDSLLDSVTFETEENGETVSHEYIMHFGNGAAGIIYNADKFQELNITVPRTTDELYDVTCAQISQKFSNDALTKAAFTESIRTAYSQYMFNVWWTQYEGADNVKNFFNGIYYKDGIKRYGNKIFEQKGRLYALEAYEKMIGPDYKNAHTNINSMTYMQAQQVLMNGTCLMMVNGNWLENEMKIRTDSNSSANIKMMPTPIISKVIEKTPSISDDETLRAVVSYVDGEGSLPDNVTEKDVETIRAARDVKYDNYAGGAFIPAYSNAKENAKRFLKYLCSAEFAQIFFDKTGGNFIGFNEDITDMTAASVFMKSVYETQGKTAAPYQYRYKMSGLGGMLVFPGTVNIPSWFASKNTEDRKTPKQIYDRALDMGTEEYFNTVLKTAGLI